MNFFDIFSCPPGQIPKNNLRMIKCVFSQRETEYNDTVQFNATDKSKSQKDKKKSQLEIEIEIEIIYLPKKGRRPPQITLK